MGGRVALRPAVQLAEALRHLHAGGQVHRDIKSENVLLSEDRAAAKWADLGVASADSDFVGDQLGDVRGFSEKDRRWAAPEELHSGAAVNVCSTARARASRVHPTRSLTSRCRRRI